MAQDDGLTGMSGSVPGEEIGLARLQSTLGFLLLGAWRFANFYFNQHFKDIDITPASYGVLLLIEANPRCSIGSVGRAMGIAPNSIARLVDGLVGRELVSKSVSGADARTRLLELTAQGRQFLEVLEQHHAEYESEVISAVGKDRHDALCVLLRPFAGAGPSEELQDF